MKNIDGMVEALLAEIALQDDFLKEDPKTIYFGGGTPSILNIDQLGQIINQIQRNFNTSMVREITLEANPEDISQDKIKGWQAMGINRISLGIQTFDEAMLQSLNRVHSGEQAIAAVSTLQDAGLENITADLIYGLPHQRLTDWQKNVEKLTALNVPHISAYALTVESNTFFGHQKKLGHLKLPSDENYEAQYLLMCKLLKNYGYEHYEVSNFAKERYRSQHNQLYWQGAPYLGIGPGAHSFNGQERYFNVSNNARYIKAINDNYLPNEKEELSQDQKYNEYLLTRLRTNDGIALQTIASKYNRDLKKDFAGYFEDCVNNNLAYFEEDNFVLTEKGFFVSDEIILKLMQ